MDQESELDLIKNAKRGNQQAFRRLVEAHQGLAYSIAFRFTKNENESEDIVQEAFVKVWNNLSGYDSAFRLKTWISRIVTNLCLDYLKSARKKKTMSENNVMITEPCFEDDQLEGKELKSIVMHLAGQLTDKQQAVFILRDLEMMTPEETCQALQMTPGNMKSNLYYARLKIKEGLQKFYKY